MTDELEVWIVVDSDGDYAAGADQEAAEDNFADNVGGNRPRRAVKVTVNVPPLMVLEAKATFAEETEKVTAKASL